MIRKIALAVLMVIFIYNKVYAGFNGPFEVLSTSYGNGDGQVGLQHGDSGDTFPFKLAVSGTGRIAICDEVNDRVVIFKSDGSFERNINILSTSVVFDNDESLYFEAEFRKFDKNGSMIFMQDVGFDEIFITYDNKIVGYDRDKKTYSLYSSTGQLISTSTTKPAELGQIKTQALGDKKYRITISYPDKTYFLTSDALFMKYVRDKNGNVYGVNSGGVWRFNQCGKEIGELIIPTDTTESIPYKNAPDKSLVLDVQYGEPIVAPSGDVYTWKKTDSKYAIVKWTWQDDPNVPSGPDAPTNLTVVPAFNGLYLTWATSPNDPGCVTGYDVSRATTAGGVGTTVATLAAGQLKYSDTTAEAGTTYYYKVRAKAGTDYSLYTSEVSGKR